MFQAILLSCLLFLNTIIPVQKEVTARYLGEPAPLLIRCAKESIWIDAQEKESWKRGERWNYRKLDELANYIVRKYYTKGKKLIFYSHSGARRYFQSEEFGWEITRSEVVKQLKHAWESGMLYLEIKDQNGNPSNWKNEFGESYIEVSIPEQKLWMYKDGELILETDCVTGNAARGYDTITGAYRINYLGRSVTLRGADYASYVDYWMPFEGNYGLHDADWRGQFGGEIYLTSGSHGCVNLPDESAKTIYANAAKGYPVLIYDNN